MAATNVRVYHSDSFKVIYMGSGAPTDETSAGANDQTPRCSYSKSQIYDATSNPKPNPFTIQYIDEETGNIFVLRRKGTDSTQTATYGKYTWTSAWD